MLISRGGLEIGMSLFPGNKIMLISRGGLEIGMSLFPDLGPPLEIRTFTAFPGRFRLNVPCVPRTVNFRLLSMRSS